MPGDRERRDDELAETATAATATPDTTATSAGAGAPSARDSGLSDQLGRYKIGRELGRGGMGVVHSAFDPDLERKIALKVLPAEVENADARQRLLREARAMARLSHPNVVTVHEVGTAHGRDFIAMELVDGLTLEGWLESALRTEREIVGAFVAAGRGLAAAHAAGLVHRDFKPRNVLRHKDGRIVVTDFGLVVGVGGDVDAFKVTQPTGSATAKTTPSSLSGLTKTGSVLGTPAYMAPEQWTGGQVGPAADQFAFCVALWEALAKERPYKGSTLDDLKELVIAGKRADESKLPRKLRKVLRRGLDPDPAKRYPSMDALLAAIERSGRRPTAILAIGGAAVVAVAVVYTVAFRSHPESKTYIITEGCTPPVLAPDKVWTPRDGELIQLAHQDLAAASLARDFKSWTDARARACKADAGVREPQLACLDGVLSRIDGVKQIVLSAKPAQTVEIDDLLVQPTLCQAPKPPRLARLMSKELRDVLAFYVSHMGQNTDLTEADADEALVRAGSDPCATATAHHVASAVRSGADRDTELARADRDAQACGDDRLIADVAMTSATIAGELADVDYRARIERAETLAARVRQPDVDGQLEGLRALLALRSDDLDGTILHIEKSIALYEQRDMFRTAASQRIKVHRWKMRRAKPEDVAAAPAMLESLRTQIVAKLGETDELVRAVDQARAILLWQSGDLKGANKLRAELAHSQPAKKPQVLSGQVVDEKGPVAGALVSVGTFMSGDSLRAAVAAGGDQRTATTDVDGRFTIPDVEAKSIVIAQLGTLRALPTWATEGMTVKLLPTSTVSGSVELHGRPSYQVTLYVVPKAQAPDFPYALGAPLGADGRFAIHGVAQGQMLFRTTVELATSQLVGAHEVAVTKPEVTGVRFEVQASGKPLHVLIRSMYGTPLNAANVFVMAGKHPAEMSLAKIFTAGQNFTAKLAIKLLPEQDAPNVHAHSKVGDLYAQIAERPPSEVSACAFPLPEHLDDPDLAALNNNMKKLEKIPVRCVPVKPTDEVVEIEIPPWPRFD